MDGSSTSSTAATCSMLADCSAVGCFSTIAKETGPGAIRLPARFPQFSQFIRYGSEPLIIGETLFSPMTCPSPFSNESDRRGFRNSLDFSFQPTYFLGLKLRTTIDRCAWLEQWPSAHRKLALPCLLPGRLSTCLQRMSP